MTRNELIEFEDMVAKAQNYLRIYEQAIKDDYTHDDAIRMAEGWTK